MYLTLKTSFDRLAGALYWVAMLAMLAMALHVFASVASRAFIGRDLSGTLEITAFYYMPLLAFAALPHLDAFGGHIRADLISAFLAPRALRSLELVIRLAMVAFFGLLAFYALNVAYDRMASSEVARSANGFMPVWPGRWVLGIAAAMTSIHYILAFFGLVLGVHEDTFHPEKVADEATGGAP
nr:TRAP transporter small permease [uncultured Celeribacter sp.]